MTYIFWRVLVFVREYFGQKNVGNKTLIDHRFLF